MTDRMLRSLEKDPRQSVQELTGELKDNRTFLARYLKALENQGHVKSERIGPEKVYFSSDLKR